MSVLTQQELEIPRSSAAMLIWVDAVHARFNTKQLKAEAREGKHFANELIHEARPMALFAHRYFGASSRVTIAHVIGNQNYDGVVEDRRERPEAIRYLEVTTTLKTYEDSLRMELLAYSDDGDRRFRFIVTGLERGEVLGVDDNSVGHDGVWVGTVFGSLCGTA